MINLAESKRTIARTDALLYATTLHMELMLDTTAIISDMFRGFWQDLLSSVIDSADTDGIVQGHKLLSTQALVRSELSQLVNQYEKMLLGHMEQTVLYIQGAHLVLHDYYLGSRILEERRGGDDDDGGFSGFFDIDKDKYPHVIMALDTQRQEVLQAAQSRLINNMNLSDRIWNLERGGRDKINQRIQQAIANKESAISLAKDLEKYVKVDERYTRWTTTRLSKLTAKDRAAGRVTGLTRKPGELKPGMAPPTKGMSYNALRLARNEIQQIHHDTYLASVDSMPWVESLNWNLSASHPEADPCDPLAAASPYAPRDYPNRPHPQCLCFATTAGLTPKDQFLGKTRSWLQGQNNFLDGYLSFMGFSFFAQEELRGNLSTLLGIEKEPEI